MDLISIQGKARLVQKSARLCPHLPLLALLVRPWSLRISWHGLPGAFALVFPPSGCSSSGVHVARSGTSFKSFKSEHHPLHMVSPDPPCKGNPSVLPDSILLLFPTHNLRNGPNVLCSNLQCDGLGRWGLGQTMRSRGWGPALEICALIKGTRAGSQPSLPVSHRVKSAVRHWKEGAQVRTGTCLSFQLPDLGGIKLHRLEPTQSGAFCYSA